MNRVTTLTLKEKKERGKKITMVATYDYTTARIVDDAGLDGIIVGDSLGMVFQGHKTTLPVTTEEMLYHTKIVKRACKRTLVIADMPFLSYQTDERDAIKNCGMMLKEGGCEAVKLEGGKEILPLVKKLVDYGIPVMGHIGLTPQKIHQFGGYRVQGMKKRDIKRLKEEAELLESAGIFSIVLEAIPMEVSKEITEKLSIPTIGIGAGPHCDGQVLVLSDLLGLYEEITPRFVKRYANIREDIKSALLEYKKEVEEGIFPQEEHSYSLRDLK